MPVLIGWAAVTGSLAWTPVILFGVIFFWTPPHYWPLSMRFRDDYATAGVPMLPVVAEPEVVGQQIVAYSWVMVATSLLLWPVAPMGWIYGGSALVLGAWFLVEAHWSAAPGAAGEYRAPRSARCGCSTARSPTWRCSSSPSRSTRSSSADRKLTFRKSTEGRCSSGGVHRGH